MAFTCVIVDDEPLARKIVRGYLANLANWKLVDEFSDCLLLEQYLGQQHIDLLLLDIQMPFISGIEFLAKLKNPPLTVFTTAHPNYAVDAFDLAAFDYLVKPISFERFHRSLVRAETVLAPSGSSVSWLSIKEGKRIYKVGIHEISCLQAYGDYVRVYTANKTYITKSKLGAFATDLPGNIVQCHRSWYINIDLVTYFEGGHVKVLDQLVPVSESFRAQVLELLG